jgi:fermentation-respiration switch protein FrsA (DUF1100 family)
VGIYAASLNPGLFRGLIIENTFSSLSDMVDELFVIAKYFKWLILRNHWSSIELVPSIQTPILYIVGDKDELVPSIMTHKLHDASTSSKLLRKVRFLLKIVTVRGEGWNA